MNSKESEKRENNMDDSRLYQKLNEIRELLFVLCVVELKRVGFAQGAIAKTLKTSKTTVNAILRDTKIEEK